MIFGSILKYIRMSNNGTTNKIGKSALTAMSIILLDVKLLNANPVPSCADSITHAIPLAAPLTPALPHGKYIKNQAKNKFKITKIKIDFHCIFFLFLEKITPIPRKINNPMILTNKNIWHLPICIFILSCIDYAIL
ncbi:hypothetical protein SEB_00338 [Staphylococcus epidermidis PM221]|nr:hypothetical protein SEB_00338 [Staphylococcus epidermidis PM221]